MSGIQPLRLIRRKFVPSQSSFQHLEYGFAGCRLPNNHLFGTNSIKEQFRKSARFHTVIVVIQTIPDFPFRCAGRLCELVFAGCADQLEYLRHDFSELIAVAGNIGSNSKLFQKNTFGIIVDLDCSKLVQAGIYQF